MTPSLTERLDALRQAASVGRDVLGGDLRTDADEVLCRSGDRLRLPTHTVVALVGPTGSGKSSLLNAIAGRTVAKVAVTRPTTSEALAIVRGDGAEPLLDWLGVRRRHRLGGEGEGLVVLDLPDHDSIVTGHRLEVDRLIALVDLMVWVVDPQKYADATVHEQYLRRLSGHGDVVLLVLNQVDRLTPDERRSCHRDLQHLLEDDGLPGVQVLDVSTRTREGVDRLTDALADAAQRRVATTARLTADVAGIAGRVLAACGPPVRAGAASHEELVDALVEAAGVPVVVEAVRGARVRDARKATGWPPARWVSRLRPDPLRALHLGKADSGHTSLPRQGPPQLARARDAVRAYLDSATSGAPESWVLAARRRVDVSDAQMAGALDAAVTGKQVAPARRPRWWRVVGVAQWILLVVAAAGAVWLAGAALLRLPGATTPLWGAVPVPTAALLGGVMLGVILGVVAGAAAGARAAREAQCVTVQLRAAVAEVAHRLVITLVDDVLAELVRTREAAQLAAGGLRGRRNGA